MTFYHHKYRDFDKKILQNDREISKMRIQKGFDLIVEWLKTEQTDKRCLAFRGVEDLKRSLWRKKNDRQNVLPAYNAVRQVYDYLDEQSFNYNKVFIAF